MKAEPIDVVFTFDTTGSMYPCLTQVRRTVKDTVKRLFKEVKGLRVGIIAHGDYCDANCPYITKALDLTDDEDKIVKFIERVEATGGGDAPECYELVLHEARSLGWRAGKTKVLAMIGDDVPHGPTYAMNAKKIDWRNELGLLLEQGIHVYGVQALNRSHATSFWKEIAQKTGGFHLSLDQFANVTDLILAVCFKQEGDSKLRSFQDEVKSKGKMTRNVDEIFATLLGREKTKEFEATDLSAVKPGRFQVLVVDNDQDIKGFVTDQGLRFRTGRGFYQFTKTESIQDHKEIILRHKRTGDFYEGPRARELLHLPKVGTARIKPDKLLDYDCFVQSTSVNRKLLGGTSFLYEVEDWFP